MVICRPRYSNGEFDGTVAELLFVRCKHQVTQRLSLKTGYERMWLQGVALTVKESPSPATWPVEYIVPGLF